MISKELALKSVLIIEDDKETMKHLLDILRVYFKKISYAFDGCDGLEHIERFHPDIIISDIKVPCLNGIAMVQNIKNDTYSPVVILSTAFSDKEYLLEALNINVDAYLIKPININTLIKKIEKGFYKATISDLKYKILSKREYEVFLDLAKGLKPSEIALKYSIKSKTISTYRIRIFEKMSFLTNADLISYAVKNNLI